MFSLRVALDDYDLENLDIRCRRYRILKIMWSLRIQLNYQKKNLEGNWVTNFQLGQWHSLH